MSTRAGRDESPRDDRIDRAWRATSAEVPSDRADAAIVAAARSALADKDPAAKRHPTVQPWWSRWAPLAAAAGVAGLAFVLLQSLPRDVPQPRSAPTDNAPGMEPTAPGLSDTVVSSRPPAPAAESTATLPPPAALSPPAARTTEPTVEVPPAAAPRDLAPGDAQRSAGRSDATTLPERPGSPPKNAATAEAARGFRQGASPDDRRSDATAGGTADGSYAVAAPSPQPPLEPQDWAARIARLFQHGDRAAAASEFRAFAAAYPDAESYLPENLRAWAAGTLAGPGRAARE